ncbi:type I restriction-modification [Leptolyngbya sp. NIES-3755]|nr:type I restriction-modification [Leptolyngbya sp. NIES-3755]
MNLAILDRSSFSTENRSFTWIESLPSGWQAVRLRHLAKEPLAYGANEAALEDSAAFPRFIRITDINEDGSLRPETFKSLAPEIAEPYLLKEGDVLLARSGATVGKAFIYKREWGKACFAGYLIKFSCNQNLLLPGFLFAFTQSSIYWSQVRSGTIQATIQNFSAEKYSEICIPLPPVYQQLRIISYLDRETEKIDALIAAKKRLLELLGEKRRSMITHAVTCGLDANAPTKDSGLEWLGTVPVHWTIEHLKYHLSDIEQGWSPQSDSYPAEIEEWGVLKVGAVNGWNFNPNENKRIPPDLIIPLEHEIKPGDILISRANTTELVGSASLVKEVRPKLLLCDKLYRPVLQSRRLIPEYLVFYLRSSSGRFEIESDATGASGSMQNISQGTIANLWIPIPPKNEQAQIVTHIENQLSLLRQLEETTQQAIALLQERRTSLISAAVTGQLEIPS